MWNVEGDRERGGSKGQKDRRGGELKKYIQFQFITHAYTLA